MKIQENKNEYVLIVLILLPSETVTIVIKYAEANFLPVGHVIKPIFATIVFTIYRYDDDEALCTECNIKKNKRYEERNRDWREEYERREAEHRRNWGGYKKNT